MGDYTRLLAEECRWQGHDCSIIALNDRYVSEPHSEGPLHLRLPAGLPWSERIKIAQARLTEFAPDWVSLQFVPYGFHPKGTAFGLARNLQPLFAGRRSHIMFHELWIGWAKEASLRHRAVGMAQKRLILSLVRQLAPDVMHTSNSTYTTMLRRSGVTAQPLPLFGNVPVSTQNADDWLWSDLGMADVKIAKTNRSDFWLGGFFGSLPPTWPPEPLLTALKAAAVQNSRQIVLLSIGRLGPGEPLWDSLTRLYSPHIRFCKLGERPASQVSQYLNSLDFGVATSPYSLIGKSGSVAAMLEHGLPVIVNRDDEHFPGDLLHCQEVEPLLHKMAVGFLVESALWMRRKPTQSRLPMIANQFLQDMSL